MNLILTYWPLILGLSLSGCVSGVFAGLLGVGGGVIIVPILSYAFEAMGFSGDAAALPGRRRSEFHVLCARRTLPKKT